MKAFYSSFRLALWALGAAGLASVPAFALPMAAPAIAQTEASAAFPAIPVAADCYALGQQVAAQNGGTLAKASQSTQGGQPVCVIVVLVPGKDGERPRRSEIVVPLN